MSKFLVLRRLFLIGNNKSHWQVSLLPTANMDIVNCNSLASSSLPDDVEAAVVVETIPLSLHFPFGLIYPEPIDV